MAILNAWQRIDRVISGLPWGDGADGSATISSDPNTRATITGTATQNTGTAGSTAFANGDLVLLHQTQGTGAGQWEINKVASGGGTVNLTFSVAHNYTYGTGAQIIKIPRYTTATVNAHAVTAWNGTTGGIEVICGKTSITGGGTLDATGKSGATKDSDGTQDVAGGAGLGQRGGVGRYTSPGYSGDGSTGNTSATNDTNGSGGGGGTASGGQGGGGGGGGNAAAGANGGGTGGVGGEAVGSADLINMCPGGGGGGAARIATGAGEYSGGGGGGGIVVLISKAIDVSSYGASTKGGSSSSTYWSGGSGAGGSILVVCETATLGTNKLDASANSAGIEGGAGSVGRIAVQHSGTITGTTTPTFTDSTDTTLVEVIASTASGSYSFFM